MSSIAETKEFKRSNLEIAALHPAAFALLPIFFSIAYVVFARYMLTPVLSFIFFAKDTSLFLPSTSFATRSIYYGDMQAMTYLASLLASVLWVSLSDYWGRKVALRIAGLGIFVLALLCCLGLWLHSIELVMMGLIVGCAADGSKSIGLACVGDCVSSHHRAVRIANLQGFIALGACLGPFLGGYLASFFWPSWMPPYALPFIVSALLALYVSKKIIHIKETAFIQSVPEKIKLAAFFKDMHPYLLQRQIWLLFFMLALAQFTWGLYYEFMPPLLKNVFHYHAPTIGIFVGLIAFWLVIATFFMVQRLKIYFSCWQIMIIASFIELIGIGMTIIASEFSYVWSGQIAAWLAIAPVAAGDVIIYCLIMDAVSQFAHTGHQGRLMGITTSVAMLVWALMGIIGGHLTAYFVSGALWIAPFGVGLLILYLLIDRNFPDGMSRIKTSSC